MLVHRHCPIVADNIDMSRGDCSWWKFPVAGRQGVPACGDFFIVDVQVALAEFDNVAFDCTILLSNITLVPPCQSSRRRQ